MIKRDPTKTHLEMIEMVYDKSGHKGLPLKDVARYLKYIGYPSLADILYPKDRLIVNKSKS